MRDAKNQFSRVVQKARWIWPDRVGTMVLVVLQLRLAKLKLVLSAAAG